MVSIHSVKYVAHVRRPFDQQIAGGDDAFLRQIDHDIARSVAAAEEQQSDPRAPRCSVVRVNVMVGRSRPQALGPRDDCAGWRAASRSGSSGVFAAADGLSGLDDVRHAADENSRAGESCDLPATICARV